MGDSHVGLLARAMSQALRKLIWHVSNSKSILIFINQNRVNIGTLFYSEVQTGGKALGYFISLDFETKRIGKATAGGVDGPEIGNKVQVSIRKNKMGAPHKVTTVDLIFNEGFSRINDIFDLATEARIIEKSGVWYSYGDQRIGQGRERAIEFIRNNENIYNEIEEKVDDYVHVKSFVKKKKKA
mgnify:CR=1 FL=1